MGIDIRVEDGTGSGNQAKVGKRNQLYVAEVFPDIPESGTKNQYRFYKVKLGSTGADSGTTNMNVDGSGTAQKFYVEANKDYDIHVMNIAIIIADTAVTHDKFGAINSLGTGWDLIITEEGNDIYLIEKAKSGGQVMVQSGLSRIYGDDATADEIVNWNTGAPAEDAQAISIPIHEFIPGGLRLGRGSKNRITSIVNDDLQGLTLFEVHLFGYRHHPEE